MGYVSYIQYMQAHDKIIVGLDVDTAGKARYLIEQLPDCSIFKIGPHFRYDPTSSEELFDRDFRDALVDETRENPLWFDDSKMFDIDATVSAGVRNLTMICNEMTGEHQFAFVTVHAHVPTMTAAVQAAKDRPLKILAVPLMTSFGPTDLQKFYNYVHPPIDFVIERVHWAVKAGCGGVICSAQEVKDLRKEVPPDFLLVVPGTRAAKIAMHDHKRSGSPAQAIRDGADYLVFARPIIEAAKPRKAFDEMVKEIEAA